MKNCLLLFVLMSFALIVRGQSTCSEAVTAVNGTNLDCLSLICWIVKFMYSNASSTSPSTLLVDANL